MCADKSIKQSIDEAYGHKHSVIESNRSKYPNLPPVSSTMHPASPLGKGVPTLKPGHYQPFSSQIQQRFEAVGRWDGATHGSWLGLDEMEALWDNLDRGEWMELIRASVRGVEAGWPDHAIAIFRPERISVFAASDLGYEMMCLLWLEFTEEPEIWAYDSNGVGRYIDLDAYLRAYIEQDLSAFFDPWILALPRNHKG